MCKAIVGSLKPRARSCPSSTDPALASPASTVPDTNSASDGHRHDAFNFSSNAVDKRSATDQNNSYLIEEQMPKQPGQPDARGGGKHSALITAAQRL